MIFRKLTQSFPISLLIALNYTLLKIGEFCLYNYLNWKTLNMVASVDKRCASSFFNSPTTHSISFRTFGSSQFCNVSFGNFFHSNFMSDLQSDTISTNNLKNFMRLCSVNIYAIDNSVSIATL